MPVIHKPLDGVRDLKLATPRRGDLLCCLEDVVIEHVDADQSQVGRGRPGLLDQTLDATVGGQLGHPILFRVLDPGQDDLAVPLRMPGEVGDQAVDPPLNDVVPQEHDEAIVTQKVA